MDVPNIHPTAVIHSTARVDEGVEIGPYAVLGENVALGLGTKVGSHAFIEHAIIGQNCVIHPFAAVGTPPQDLKYRGEAGRLIMGNECTAREFVTLNRGTLSDGGDGVTRIGNKCFFMANSHVAHDCQVADGTILINSVALAGHVTVEEGTIFGGLSAAHQFVRIGRFAMIGGATGVERDVPPYALVEGNRARIIGVNIVGLKRRGTTREELSLIRQAFALLFSSEHPLAQAIETLEAQQPKGIVLELINFLKAPSKRGITSKEKGLSL